MTTDIQMLSSSLRSHHCHQPARPRQPRHPQLGTSSLASNPNWARWLAPSRSASPYQPRPAQPADPIGIEHSSQPTQVTPASYHHCKPAEVITANCEDFCILTYFLTTLLWFLKNNCDDFCKHAEVITMVCDDFCKPAVVITMACDDHCGRTVMLGRRSNPRNMTAVPGAPVDLLAGCYVGGAVDHGLKWPCQDRYY